MTDTNRSDAENALLSLIRANVLTLLASGGSRDERDVLESLYTALPLEHRVCLLDDLVREYHLSDREREHQQARLNDLEAGFRLVGRGHQF